MTEVQQIAARLFPDMPQRPRIEPIDRSVGRAMGLFLADLTSNISTDALRANRAAGKYAGACPTLMRRYFEFERGA